MIHKNTQIIYITHVLTHIIYMRQMIKLISKAYKKSDKFFYIIIFLYIKMLTGHYLKKTKKYFQERLVKSIKIFLKKKKTKGANMLVSDIEFFLKKKKERRVNIVVKDIKIF